LICHIFPTTRLFPNSAPINIQWVNVQWHFFPQNVRPLLPPKTATCPHISARPPITKFHGNPLSDSRRTHFPLRLWLNRSEITRAPISPQRIHRRNGHHKLYSIKYSRLRAVITVRKWRSVQEQFTLKFDEGRSNVTATAFGARDIRAGGPTGVRRPVAWNAHTTRLSSLFYQLPAFSVTPYWPGGHYMYRQFNIQQFYVLPTQCNYAFCVDMRTNSDYFPTQR